jgi:hypothetical protein
MRRARNVRIEMVEDDSGLLDSDDWIRTCLEIDLAFQDVSGPITVSGEPSFTVKEDIF